MPVVTVRIEKSLVHKLEELAQLRRITRSALIKEILEEAVERRSTKPVRNALLALRQERKSSKEIDWSRIERELRQSKPYFSTVAEALAYSRKRAE